MLSPRAIWISGFIFCFLDLQGYLFPSGLICRKSYQASLKDNVLP